jgi:hypothetical protein
MSSSILSIIAIVLSSLLALITLSFEVKKNGRLTKPGITAIVLSILLVLFSVYSILQSEDENETKFTRNMLRLDTLVQSANISVARLDSSIKIQTNLQDSTRKIDSITRIQLNLQHQVLASTLDLLDSSETESMKSMAILNKTRELLSQNEKILIAQKNTLDNTERIVNPVILHTLHMAVVVPFENPHLKALVDSLYRIKEALEKKTVTSFELISSYVFDKNEIAFMRINKPEVILANSYRYRYIGGRYYHLSFRKEPRYEKKYERKDDDIFLQLFLPVENLKEIDFGLTVQVDFRRKGFILSYNFTSLNMTSKHDVIGEKDFVNSYALLTADNEDINFQVLSVGITSTKDKSIPPAMWMQPVSEGQSQNPNRKLFHVNLRTF